MTDLIFNPAIISILTLCILCVCKVNVLLSILISTIIAGLVAGMNLTDIMNTFISGMGGNSETALSYILLGTFAAAMTYIGFTDLISKKITNIVGSKKYILLAIICLMAMMSQNIIPIHIAFIPIIIPALIPIINTLNIDRRVISCVLAFGLKMPYIVIPAGFGLIFQNLIADNMTSNGMEIARSEIWKYNWILGLGMTVGLLISIFITYRKPRKYKDIKFEKEVIECEKFNKSHYITLFAAIMTFIVQIWTKSLPLGALVGLGIIFSFKAVKHSKMDNLINEGVYLMGYIAFVMLVAAGFATVLKTTGGIDNLINTIVPLLPHDKIITAFIILIVGLFITIGIGTSFGTIPILAVLIIPICAKLGFNTAETVVLLSAAAALGDAGSPASDTTLGPTAGLNIDGQHNHISDTCIPTFLHYNTALIIFAIIGIWIF